MSIIGRTRGFLVSASQVLAGGLAHGALVGGGMDAFESMETPRAGGD